MIFQEGDIRWLMSLDDARTEGYAPVKCWSLLQFYQFRTKTPADINEKIKQEIPEIMKLHKVTKTTANFYARERYGLYKKENSCDLVKANLEPIRYLYYVVFAKAEGRYYMRLSRPYSVDDLYFYYSGRGETDEAIENLRRYVMDGNVWLLFTVQQIADTSAMLERLWKAHLSGDGKLDYRIYLQILETSLKFEEYKDASKELTGYKTVCRTYENALLDLWKRAFEKNKP